MSERSEEVRRREVNERVAFARVATAGRALEADDALRLPASTIERYQACAAGAEPRTPLEQMIAWASPLPGKKVLEICGHTAEYGAILARLGATVVSVDIVEPLVRRARVRAAVNGVAERLFPAVMTVHSLALTDGCFDVVFGKAALHHLDLVHARDECLRVLKSGGVGVFAEPVAFSQALAGLRRLTPVPSAAESPDERPLTEAEIETFCGPFSARHQAFSRLLGRMDRVWPGAVFGLMRIDRWLLCHFPSLERYCGTCTFAVTR